MGQAKGLRSWIMTRNYVFIMFFSFEAFILYHCSFFYIIVSLLVCVFVFTSPSRTLGVLYNHSLCSPCSLCSKECPLKLLEPKRPSRPPGQTTLLTSAWTSWVQACIHPNLASPVSTPSNKVRSNEHWQCNQSLSCLSKLTLITCGLIIWHFS